MLFRLIKALIVSQNITNDILQLVFFEFFKVL